jgi:site-specific recombinase XerD
MEIPKSSKSRFRQYLEGKDLAPATITNYIRYIDWFFKRVKTEAIQVTKPDILNYLEHLKNSRKQQNITRQNCLTALNHYFTFLYKSGKITENPCQFLKIRGTSKKKLHKIYTPEELDELCDNYYQLFVRNDENIHSQTHNQLKQYALGRNRNAVMVSILANQGIRTTEINKIETNDLDLIKATLKIRSGKRLRERILPLKATQIGLFFNYLQNIHPQLLEYQETESDKLFLSLPERGSKRTDRDTLEDVFYTLIRQIRTIDKQFFNFQQIRTSVITSWLKAYGLRKTQHLAGHRFISSTEKYLPNNLDGLTEDINKLHPFGN